MSEENALAQSSIYRYEVIDRINSISLLGSDYLYHYTTLSGCLGILESSSLWASDARCLNDTLELTYGIDLICDELLKLPVATKHRLNIEIAMRNLRSHPRDIYIASFSTNADQLGQWRAYAGNGGVNIGLPYKKLVATFRTKMTLMGPVVYDVTEQKKLVSDLIAELLRRNRSFSVTDSAEDGLNTGINFDFNALLLAACMKHPKFAEEDEWRVAVQFALPREVKFRATNSMIIPYLPIQIDFTTDQFADLRIIVGPMPHASLVKDIVVAMLRKKSNFAKKSDVRSSEIPYRNW